MSRVNAAAHRHPFLIAFLTMGLVVSVGFYRTQQIADNNQATSKQQADDNRQRISDENAIIRALHADLFCIERWANSTTRRTQKLQPLATARIEDLFHAFRVALKGRNGEARRLAGKAIREDGRYLRAVRRNPIPTPQLHCHLYLPQPPPPKHHAHASPHPSPTVTRTVTVPGPTHTVVRTVTEPPGKHHGRRPRR